MNIEGRSLMVRTVLKEELVRVLEEYRDSHADPLADPEAVLGLVGTRAEEFRTAARVGHPDLPGSYLSFRGVDGLDADFSADGDSVDEFDPNACEMHRLSYLDAGDAYRDTLCFDHSEKTFFVGSWGGWSEKRVPRLFAWDEEIAAALEAAKPLPGVPGI